MDKWRQISSEDWRASCHVIVAMHGRCCEALLPCAGVHATRRGDAGHLLQIRFTLWIMECSTIALLQMRFQAYERFICLPPSFIGRCEHAGVVYWLCGSSSHFWLCAHWIYYLVEVLRILPCICSKALSVKCMFFCNVICKGKLRQFF